MRDGFRKLFSKLTQVDKAEVKRLEKEIIDRVTGAA
jgi:hypothetical protein